MGRWRYSDFAADCVRLAGQTTDPASKLRLRDMAVVWIRLADQTEKNSQTDLVYEAPVRPEHTLIQ
jgi:hypothetical protein